jgi:small GTP-binding protein
MAMFDLKVVLLGEVGVGKSCIVSRFVADVFDPLQLSTVGSSYISKTINVDKRDIKFQIWDTGKRR